LMILSATLGIFGIVMGLLVILIHMASLRSFGVCYISPFTPMKLKDYSHSVFKLPLRFSTTRPSFIQENNPTRVNKASKSKPPKDDS
jgi:spore germination protein KA